MNMLFYGICGEMSDEKSRRYKSKILSYKGYFWTFSIMLRFIKTVINENYSVKTRRETQTG